MGLEPGDPGYLEESRQPMLYALTYASLGFSTIFFALRLYCKIFLVKSMKLFDWIMLVAYIDVVAMCIMTHLQIYSGMGRHLLWSQMHPDMHVLSMKVGYVQNICYQTSLGIIKASILVQYLAISAQKRDKRIIKGFLIFVIIFNTFTSICAILLCLPISAAWNLDTFPKGCWNTAPMNISTSTINTVTDIAIFIIPIPILYKLRMEKRKKGFLIGIFCVAFVSVGASLGRVSSLVAWTNEGDTTYVASMIPVWGVIETNVAIAAISLPLLNPLFRVVAEETNRFYSSARSWNRRPSGPAKEYSNLASVSSVRVRNQSVV